MALWRTKSGARPSRSTGDEPPKAAPLDAVLRDDRAVLPVAAYSPRYSRALSTAVRSCGSPSWNSCFAGRSKVGNRVALERSAQTSL